MDEHEITIEEIKTCMQKWEKYKETAEQHAFVDIYVLDRWITIMYEDICQRWDDEHAKILMKYFDAAFKKFGIE